MPYFVVNVREVATHQIVVLAKSKKQVMELDTDVFADICSTGKAFFSLDERVIESVEKEDRVLPDDAHMDVRDL